MAGKKTIGQQIATALGLPFEGELGELLRANKHEIGACMSGHSVVRTDGTLEEEAKSWDDTIFCAEEHRDHADAHLCGRVVETWHVGNLAWAALRESKLFEF